MLLFDLFLIPEDNFQKNQRSRETIEAFLVFEFNNVQKHIEEELKILCLTNLFFNDWSVLIFFLLRYLQKEINDEDQFKPIRDVVKMLKQIFDGFLFGPQMVFGNHCSLLL